MGLKEWVGGRTEAAAMVSMIAVQILVTGMQLLSRVILNQQGTFIFALMTYRHLVAFVFLAPLAFFIERDMVKKLTWSALFWIFTNALIGITMAMSLYYYGLRDTTATYGSTFLNLIPIITYIFSTITGVEKLGLRSRAGRVKLAGVIVCVGGALISTVSSVYKGKDFSFYLRRPSHHSIMSYQLHIKEGSNGNWTRGTMFLMGSSFCYATWFILQVKLLKVYPFKYSATMIMCIIASLQSMVIGLSMDRSKVAWRLQWDLQLLTIVYSGVLATATTFWLISWAVVKRGPTYPSMFNPLSLIFVAIAEALVLGEQISLGSILGTLMIILGLYAFLWGNKSNESPQSLQKKPAKASVAEIKGVPDVDQLSSSPHYNNTINVEETQNKEQQRVGSREALYPKTI
ncbi:WAT1-related protein At5g64700-like [Telopea speciosissima]|uniref:WAT1-related protein At5g64700-like n=1 Tax=Telopea speciosissima TaxID=54955 RepID=UPI001CC49460|nr:WAT1-related protein At5g64700-like [Telopea speciosissima]